ncbi:MAG: ribosome maturation factor RimM [Hyphomicrobiaceae bacterium]|nr:ribosome maturation factor RimM [Hyphomicrobiaceae bacterium]
MPGDRKARVCLGRFSGARGLKGEVRIKTFTAQPQSIADYGPLEDETGARSFELSNVKPAKDGVVAIVRGVTTREQAEALKGIELYVDRDTLPETGDDTTYYHADLIGLVAVSEDGAALGKIIAVQNYGAGDLLEVRPATGGATVLVPFTEAVVPDIDQEAGWLLMIPPEGVFEP